MGAGWKVVAYEMWRDGPYTGPADEAPEPELNPDNVDIAEDKRLSHVTTDADFIPGAGAIYWGVDDGYAGEIDERSGLFKAGSHPRVFLLAQMRSGVLNIFAESYRIQTRAVRQIAGVIEMGYPEPEFCAVDKSAAALKGELHNSEWGDLSWQLYTRNSPPRVLESMKVVREWLTPDKNNQVRVKVHPRCTYFRIEMATYGLDLVTGKPIKDFDHGPDALRNLVWTLRVMG